MNKKCQVFTPHDYVEKILDSVGYRHNLYGKKIIENSCGDGNILSVVVQRYIDDCKLQGVSGDQIIKGLSEDIYGVEIDPDQFEKCIERLNEIVKKNGLSSISWNIICKDYLRMDDSIQYDYVVGNPPYITYSELRKNNQEYLKKHFISCKKGKFDYCYAFLEKSLSSLAANGRMAYLIPSSVYKTVFGKAIRDMMLPYVEKVIDYTQEKLFEDALVKSSILVLNKGKEGTNLSYTDDSVGNEAILNSDNLGKKWIFTQTNNGQRRFGDYFKVSHVVATLCNEAFVLKQWSLDEKQNYICNGCVLENELVHDAISPKNMRSGKKEKIIFPYDYDGNHILIRYSEDEFIERFPGVAGYLGKFREKLDKRDSDLSAQWFEYGRSQALAHLDCCKALISTIISNEIIVYNLNQRAIPYAGMYIVAITDQLSIDEAINELQSDAFLDYAKNVGIPVNGDSVRVTSKDIEDYRF